MHPTFPTQYSLLSATALSKVIGSNYTLDIQRCKLLIHNVSDTYLVEDASKKYIFRIYRTTHRSLEEIKGELYLLNILKEKGARVAFPIPDRSGNELQEFNAAEGVRYGVLFSYANGAPVYNLSDTHLDVIGTEMAAVHNITADLEIPYYRHPFTVDTIFTKPIATVKTAFEQLPEEYAYLQQAVATVKSKIALLDLAHFSHGYCHYDFLPKNFHFETSKELTFFDFDFAAPGFLINDIATFYAHFFIEVYYGKMTQPEADLAFERFLLSYQKIRPLSPDEIKAIPYFGFGFFIFFLEFQYQNFEEWSNFFFGPKFLKERTAMLKTWMEWYITPDL